MYLPRKISLRIFFRSLTSIRTLLATKQTWITPIRLQDHIPTQKKQLNIWCYLLMQHFLGNNMVEGFKSRLLQPNFTLFNNTGLKSNFSVSKLFGVLRLTFPQRKTWFWVCWCNFGWIGEEQKNWVQRFCKRWIFHFQGFTKLDCPGARKMGNIYRRI